MSLISRGQGLRNLATSGFRKASEIEAQDVRQAQALEAAKEAQEGQTLGAGASIGTMYGLRNVPASSGGTTVSVAGGGNPFNPTPAPGLNPTPDAIVGASSNFTTPATVSEVTGLPSAMEGVTALTEGSSAVATGTAGSGGAGGAAAGSSSAGGSGLMSNIGSIAAPVAIGLGVAFLINKLFD